MKTMAHTMAHFVGLPGVFHVYSLDRHLDYDNKKGVLGYGEVSEWLIELVSKTSVLYGAPRVRIPPSPFSPFEVCPFCDARAGNTPPARGTSPTTSGNE